MTKQIPLGGKLGTGKYVLVDDADYPFLSQFNWWVKRGSQTMYAATHAMKDGRKMGVPMHQMILPVPPEMVVDHINGDGLDNRRDNLRQATRKQNTRNSKAKIDKLTGSVFKGVFKQGNGWQAAISVDRKQIYLGFFDTQRDAAQAYNDAALKYHGEFARLNDLSAIAPKDDPPIRSHQHSRFKGVSWHKKERKWNAYAFVNGRQIRIGGFTTEIEAVMARDAYVIEHGLPLKINLVRKDN